MPHWHDQVGLSRRGKVTVCDLLSIENAREPFAEVAVCQDGGKHHPQSKHGDQR